ncbi:hypothetical protein V511_12975 [Mesotoga sp. Brook.08.YT.4.2.5.1]|nr:hypothetical protein V511_12975 [Mesotoga sp. Brook.08.YT.4.2.5.1]
MNRPSQRQVVATSDFHFHFSLYWLISELQLTNLMPVATVVRVGLPRNGATDKSEVFLSRSVPFELASYTLKIRS